MRSFLLICLLLSLGACLNKNKLDTNPANDSVIWPLQEGNSWHYKGFIGYFDNGSKDTTDLVIEIDTTILIDGREYFAAKGHHDKCYRSFKSKLYESDIEGNKTVLLSSNVTKDEQIYQESGTFEYFEGGTFAGTLIRTVYPEITVVNNYNCFKTEDLYKDENGNTVQRKLVYYANDKGPVCYKFYGNRETPGNGNIYLMLQYTIDSMVVQK